MANQQIENVFHNDYIMAHILRMLDLKEQYEMQKICSRLRFLIITCVWRRDCKKMEMNRDEMGLFTDEEYFDMLQLNSENIKTLAINDGTCFLEHFTISYENLLEFHIKGFDLDDDHLWVIVNNCRNLQLFDYTGNSFCWDEKLNEFQSLEMLRNLTKLRVLILKYLVRYVYYGDLFVLAADLHLEHLEVDLVKLSGVECFPDNVSLNFPCLRVLKLYDKFAVEFVKKCPNLKELKVGVFDGVPDNFFDAYYYLEKIRLHECDSESMILGVITTPNLRHLELYCDPCLCLIPDVAENCINLQSLVIYNERCDVRSKLWANVFQSPGTTFPNLQVIDVVCFDLTDEFVRCLSWKCQHLKTLKLSFDCELSGKYINSFQNLRKLKIHSVTYVNWSVLYTILQDLKMLQYLGLFFDLIKDDFTKPENIIHLGNSLEFLTIQNPENVSLFWEYILPHCTESFLKLHTLKIKYGEAVDCRSLSCYGLFKQMKTLKVIESDFVGATTFSKFKHVVLKRCTLFRWENVIRILKDVETFAMLYTTLEEDTGTCCDDGIFASIQKLTIPYEIFKVDVTFWHQFLRNCPQFELHCIGHFNQDEILSHLFVNSETVERVAAIYANIQLRSIKCFLAKQTTTSKIPVYWLDADSADFQNRTHKCEIIIKTL